MRRSHAGVFALVAPVLVFACLGIVALRYPQILGNGKDVVRQTLFGQPGFALLLALVFLKPLATAACLGSGAPGGLFMPTMTLGALLGGMLGAVWSWIWPSDFPGGFAEIGACAVLAASTQGPVSAIVPHARVDAREYPIVPTALAAASAVAVARLLESRSIYSARIHRVRSEANRELEAIPCAARNQSAHSQPSSGERS